MKLTPEIIAEWKRELPRLQKVAQTGNLPVTTRLCLGAILDVLESALDEVIRLTPVVGDAASPPSVGEQTRTSGQAGEGSAPHPPRA